MPEIIDAVSGGRLIRTESPEELAGSIVSALEDDDLYEACAAAAPDRRTHYSWSRAADQVLAVAASIGR
jgi:glycosyltransferase involved in cell wall biosynthesis